MKLAGQLPLPMPKPNQGRGGARPGAGRPCKKGTVPHGRRPFHESKQPVHVTVRAIRRVGSLRRHRVAKVIGERLREVATADRFAERRRRFRVVHFSIQPDHLHLIVEAGSAKSLSRGLQGLLLHVARLVNRRLQRRGKLFAQRFHARALASPLEVRRAVVYVLTNAAKHPEPFADLGTLVEDGIDPCSSAPWFDGWRRPPPAKAKPPPVVAPITWLLDKGWKRHGLLRRNERPAE